MYMTVVCSWCRHEGQAGVVGEKAPFEDRRETHGICPSHRVQVRAGWKDLSVSTQHEAGHFAVAEQMRMRASHLLSGLRNLSRKAGL
ncbi:MAG: hypothetical protein U0412_03635 [Nitrospira sp.]